MNQFGVRCVSVEVTATMEMSASHSNYITIAQNVPKGFTVKYQENNLLILFHDTKPFSYTEVLISP